MLTEQLRDVGLIIYHEEADGHDPPAAAAAGDAVSVS
jgi:hypothetical protein